MITRVAGTNKQQMTKTFDGQTTPMYGEIMPCGGVPTFDHESSCYSYRCDQCFAVVGSVGMPGHCKELWDNEIKEKEVFEKLGGTL